MRLSRFQNRLLAYNAFTFHFATGESGVINMPVAAKKLDGIFTLIFDGYPVGKDKVILAGARICRLIFGLHCYLDSLCDFGYHRFKNINFLISAASAETRNLANSAGLLICDAKWT